MSITEQIYESMKQGIANGTYQPSENLPEQELSNVYGVSRNTIKKVLLMLERENLVVIEPNKGAKVRSYSMDEVLEFLELRANLEGFITRLAVNRFTPDDIKNLEETLRVMKVHYSNNELIEYSKNNQIFHNAIYSACPNKLAVELTKNLKSQMSKYNTKTILIPGRDSQSYSEHSAILDAIKNKDSDLADALMVMHIMNVRKTFKENYKFLF
ncbi:GntR family transcriptional regulator [Youngiibacter multivorans]|uniref:DNA-binding GntR family transcriptional regulator n=1 Tax=Youngiibacter multivorans TaxID=937251 RepID=A0ABS4G040_9CLOT|nr:GntR family transcriptional regulator [Youngiibacter multivorans]MBP1917908.1 DNA-binding GntR family transcriptional regulator [Youngiibacter multivorans]